MAQAENAPADEDRLDVLSLPVTASIATTATKECIVSVVCTEDACDTELEPNVKRAVRAHFMGII